MPAATDERYDAASKTLWIFCDAQDPDTLLPHDELMEHSKALRQGALDDGRPLRKVAYVFSNDEVAKYNESALSFLKLDTYTGDLQNPRPLSDASSFKVEEDFGIS